MILLIIIAFANVCLGLGTDEAIYINSNTLEVDYAIGTAEYQTNVYVHKKNGFDLHCDRAKIFFTNKRSLDRQTKANSSNIDRIELYDNISIVKGTRMAKGDFGTIYPKKKLIVLTGKVALKEKTDQREGYLEGSEVKYYIDRGIFDIKNDRPGTQKNGRVRVILNELEQ
jgi:lipopolysaccharide export system protein LptA